jgi:hypothetical protein
MINSNSSLEGTGFSYRSEVQLSEAATIEKSTSSQTAVRSLLKGLITKDIYLIRYLRYSTYGDYMTLFSYDGVPLIMAGENSYGNRMVVFAFSLHDSNLVLTGDYINLVGNLLNFSFPSVLDKTGYIAGDEAIINTVAGADSIKVISPLGNEKYLDTQKAMNTLVLDEVGTYKVISGTGENQSEHLMYVSTPNEECDPRRVSEGSFNIEGEAVRSTRKGVYNPLIIIFIALIIIFAADWMVFMYEKRQLR